jgi:hypothetical protein
MNLEKHPKTYFAIEVEYSKHIHSYWLKDVEEHKVFSEGTLSDSESPKSENPNDVVNEFTVGKNKIVQHIHVQVSYAIPQYAKLRIRELY